MPHKKDKAKKEVMQVIDISKPEIRTYKYETNVRPRLDEIYQWLLDGMTYMSIADSLNISWDSLKKYMEEISELSELCARARKERNNTVMNKMFSKASGMIGEVKQQKLDKEGNIIELRSEIYVPPDVNAADLYLRNNSDDYKSAKSFDGQTVNILNNFQLPQLSEQIALLEQKEKDLQKLLTVSTEDI